MATRDNTAEKEQAMGMQGCAVPAPVPRLDPAAALLFVINGAAGATDSGGRETVGCPTRGCRLSDDRGYSREEEAGASHSDSGHDRAAGRQAAEREAERNHAAEHDVGDEGQGESGHEARTSTYRGGFEKFRSSELLICASVPHDEEGVHESR